MLWVKAFHIVFMVTWFAGLFYLPRLFIYHEAATDEAERSRLAIMEKRLFAIMTIGGALTAAFGLWMLFAYAWQAYSFQAWLKVKLILVLGLIGYHGWCWKLMRDLARGECRHGSRWLRFFNEVPGLFLIAIVVLTVVQPF